MARVRTGTRIDRIPTEAQLSGWLTKPGAPEMRTTSTVTLKANGDSQIEVTDRPASR